MSESRQDWISELAKELTHICPKFTDEVREMTREELQRRLLNASEWLSTWASVLDGIPEINQMPGAGADGSRKPEHVRQVVKTLVRLTPLTWDKSAEGMLKLESPASSSHAEA
ncbi:hypothetical protein ACYPKM_01055 [Pseudomonas aeruginosa]